MSALLSFSFQLLTWVRWIFFFLRFLWITVTFGRKYIFCIIFDSKIKKKKKNYKFWSWFSVMESETKKKKKIETSHYFSFLSFLTKQKMGYNLFEIWFNQRSFLKMETKMKLKRLHSLFVLKTVQRTLRLTLRLGFLIR